MTVSAWTKLKESRASLLPHTVVWGASSEPQARADVSQAVQPGAVQRAGSGPWLLQPRPEPTVYLPQLSHL